MGRGSKRLRNPFRVIRKMGELTIYTFFGALVAAGVTGVVVGVWTEHGWGAWALTVPLIIVVGLAAAAVVLALIGALFEAIGDWWKKRERAYEQKARESRT